VFFYGAAYQKSQSAVFILPEKGVHLQLSSEQSVGDVEITQLGPDLLNILRQSYDYLTIMPKLRSTYDGRLIY